MVEFAPGMRDPLAIANQIAAFAGSCWIGKDPAFVGFELSKIEPGSDTRSWVINFKNTDAASARHLRIRVAQTSGWAGSTLVGVEQVDAEAAKSEISKAARSIVEFGSASCTS